MEKDFWFDFVAGWIGGCAGLVVGHPLDTIKVRQQTMGNVPIVKGIINTFKFEGVRGFYKGMGFPLLATGTLNSIFFGVYGNCLRYLSKDKEAPSYLHICLAGCAGGVFQLSVACPVDLVKIKMQMQTGSIQGVWGAHYESHYKGPTACLKDLYKMGGIRGCYTGLHSMLYRDVPSFGIYMVLYIYFLRRIAGSESKADASAMLMAGGLAGVISWASILPLDVVKSRIQGDDPNNPKYKNAIDCFVKSYKQEGLRVFGKGFTMMSLRAFPTNAAIFLGYETSLSLLRGFSSSTVTETI
ncbi:solute carrier family 25 member 45-like isoform X1 [Macrobrachium rosenbergii]|uniref:solute carrier family 25 member 45-like isoform X1 n=2 Tax=Macrobrachium rosenbergii TaxID=79674 RepID=UPI0034D4F67E